MRTGKFTPAPGVTVDESYLEAIHNTVVNKITYSRWVLEGDFFNYLVPYVLPETEQ